MLAFGVALSLLGIAACRRSAPLPSDKQLQAYRQAASPVVRWLERERAEKGCYPASLPSGVQASLAGVGPAARYLPYNGNANYQISVGDYQRDGWTYFYNSKSRSWTRDG